MGFNSKAYLEYEERRLEPDSVLRKGNHKWHQPVIIQHATMPVDNRTKQQIQDAEDEFLKSKNIC